MNAIFATDDRVNLFDAKEATRQVRALGLKFDNRSTTAEEYAVENLLADRPAFWSSARGYSNQTAGIFIEVLGSMLTIKDTIEECEHFHPHADGRWRNINLLEQLLPLNRPAVRELLNAYEAIGSFRSAAELVARTAKHQATERLVA